MNYEETRILSEKEGAKAIENQYKRRIEKHINRNCQFYDWGGTALREYGAFCKYHMEPISNVDCKNCKKKLDTRLNKAIIITLEDWVIVYYKGERFAEGHTISPKRWVELGILMNHDGMAVSSITEIWLDENDVSNKELLWDWPDNINNLHDKIKDIIIKKCLNERKNNITNLK